MCYICLNTCREIGTESCGLDSVFPVDDLKFDLENEKQLNHVTLC